MISAIKIKLISEMPVRGKGWVGGCTLHRMVGFPGQGGNVPDATVSAKVLRWKHASYGECRGAQSQRRDKNRDQLSVCFVGEPTGFHSACCEEA